VPQPNVPPRAPCVPCTCIKDCFIMNQQMHTYKHADSQYNYTSPTCFSHSCEYHHSYKSDWNMLVQFSLFKSIISITSPRDLLDIELVIA
jgi:hypothetical protein